MIARGYEAYLVGGCVRDLLLERSPKDYDIATEARPQQVKRTFPRNCRIIGRRFKLAHLHFHNNSKILEVSTFRRTPQESNDDDLLITRDNEFGTAEEDALRRDFTVNALFLDPTRNCILDYTDGLQDVRDRVIRTIGDPVVRFREDPVRILRAAKFAGRLGFHVEERTLAAMADVAPDLVRAAAPRLLEEILRLLRGGHALDSFQLLRDIGAMKSLLPIVADFLGRAPQPDRVSFWRLLESLDHVVHEGQVPANPVLLGALFAPPVDFQTRHQPGRSPTSIAEELLGPLSTTLRLSRRDAGCLKRICGVQHRFGQLDGEKRFKVQGFLHGPYFWEALDLFGLQSLAHGLDPALANEWHGLARDHGVRSEYGPRRDAPFHGAREDDRGPMPEPRHGEPEGDDTPPFDADSGSSAAGDRHDDVRQPFERPAHADADLPDEGPSHADGAAAEAHGQGGSAGDEPFEPGRRRRRRRRRRRGHGGDRFDDRAELAGQPPAGTDAVPGDTPLPEPPPYDGPDGEPDLPDPMAEPELDALPDDVPQPPAGQPFPETETGEPGERRRRRRRRRRRGRRGDEHGQPGESSAERPFPANEDHDLEGGPPTDGGDDDRSPEDGGQGESGPGDDAVAADAGMPDAGEADRSGLPPPTRFEPGGREERDGDGGRRRRRRRRGRNRDDRQDRPQQQQHQQHQHQHQQQHQHRQQPRNPQQHPPRQHSPRREERQHDRNRQRAGGRDVDVVPRYQDRRGKVEVIEPPPLDLSAFDVELDPKRVPTFGSIVEGKGRPKRRAPRVPEDGGGIDDYKPPPPPGGDAPPPAAPPPDEQPPDTFGDW